MSGWSLCSAFPSSELPLRLPSRSCRRSVSLISARTLRRIASSLAADRAVDAIGAIAIGADVVLRLRNSARNWSASAVRSPFETALKFCAAVDCDAAPICSVTPVDWARGDGGADQPVRIASPLLS